MELGYEIKGFKKLKRGYTTGTCATAASKAATYMLLNKEILDDITVTLPSGDQITLDIGDVTIKDNYASCSVVKDGGDDPDITTGTKIYSKVEINPNNNDIELDGGQGVGRVTRTGLPAKVGESAINPVPRQMILSEVDKVISPFDIELSFRSTLNLHTTSIKKSFSKTTSYGLGISFFEKVKVYKEYEENNYTEEEGFLENFDFSSVIKCGGHEGSIHPNGGGFVANTAKVDETSYVGFNAQVCDTAMIKNGARIIGSAKDSLVWGP